MENDTFVGCVISHNHKLLYLLQANLVFYVASTQFSKVINSEFVSLTFQVNHREAVMGNGHWVDLLKCFLSLS